MPFMRTFPRVAQFHNAGWETAVHLRQPEFMHLSRWGGPGRPVQVQILDSSNKPQSVDKLIQAEVVQ